MQGDNHMCSQQTPPDTCVRQVIPGRYDSAGAPGVKGETKVLISVSDGSLSTMDVGLSNSWNTWLSNNSIKLWCIRNLHVIMVYLRSCCNPFMLL